MRNPPDAFHNSAGALAQHNLVGVIIQAIKMQSLGIFKRLTNLRQTINQIYIKTTTAGAGAKSGAGIQTFETTTIVAVIKKTIQMYVHKIQKIYQEMATFLLKMIKSTVFVLRQEQQKDVHKEQRQMKQQGKEQQYFQLQNHLRKNLIIENEFKTFKHFSTQETHVSRHETEKHCKMWQQRKLSKNHLFYSRQEDKKTLTALKKKSKKIMKTKTMILSQNYEENSNFMLNFYVNQNFQQHIKQEEILYKFNNIFITKIFQTDVVLNLENQIISFMTNLCNWLIIILIFFYLSLILIINFLPKIYKNPLKYLRNIYSKYLRHNTVVLILQQFLQINVSNILWHINFITKMVLNMLIILHTKFSLYLNSKTTQIKSKTSLSSLLSFKLKSSSSSLAALANSSSLAPSSSSSLSTSLSSTSSSSSSALPCSTTLLFCR